MKSRTITTPDYIATEWSAGSKLKASQLNAISATLDAVENEVRTIGETTIPAINTAVSDLQSKVAGLETAGSALDLPEGQTVTGYVDQKVADLVGSAPETLDTIAEVAAALEQSEDAVEAINQLVTENSTAIDAVEAKVDEVATQVQTINEMLPEQLEQKQDKGDYPVYQKFSAGADPAERKTIQLANADSISGVSTTGGGANLIMMSKWDKVDIGSVNYQMNLNSPDGVVQINDDLVVATTKDIDAVTKSSSEQANSMMVNKDGQISFSAVSKDPEGSQVGIVVNKDAFTILCNYRGSNNTGLNAQLTPSSFIVKTVNAEGSQSSVDLLKAVQPEAIADMLTKTEAGTTYATKQELASKVDTSALSVYATKEDLSAKADASAIADMLTKTEAGETYATQDQLASKANVDHTHTIDQVTDLQTKLDAKIEQPVIDRVYEVLDQMNSNSAKALDAKVSWDQQKKVISLPKDGSISAMRGDPIEGSEPEGGVLLAQRSYDDFTSYVTEVGTTKNKLTLNASERPQIDIAGGSSEKVAYVSDIPSTEGLATETALTEGLAGKADTVHTHAIADVTGLQAILDLMPVEIKLPIRTGIGGFQDKLYTQEEIFAWFGVTDLSGLLALAKSTRQVWISYVVSASFQTSAYRYLANYIEYVPSSQSITVIWVGPDSANADIISKFVFKANLDQTVISGASNVQLTVTSIE